MIAHILLNRNYQMLGHNFKKSDLFFYYLICFWKYSPMKQSKKNSQRYEYWKGIEQNCTNFIREEEMPTVLIFLLDKVDIGLANIWICCREEGSWERGKENITFRAHSLLLQQPCPQPIVVPDQHRNAVVMVSWAVASGFYLVSLS